jgi:aromatic ring hydroxylase
MKFDPTWRQVALLAVLLAAVIVTHVWAPLAVSAITSIASTIVGALFVNLPSKPADASAPALAPKVDEERPL